MTNFMDELRQVSAAPVHYCENERRRSGYSHAALLVWLAVTAPGIAVVNVVGSRELKAECYKG